MSGNSCYCGDMFGGGGSNKGHLCQINCSGDPSSMCGGSGSAEILLSESKFIRRFNICLLLFSFTLIFF